MCFKSTVVILVATLGVAACSTTKEVEVFREVSAPTDPLADLYRLVATSDHYLQGRFHHNGDIRGWPRDCFRAVCYYEDRSQPFVAAVTVASISRQGFEHDRVVEDLPILVSRNDDGEWTAYGVWMDHAAFFASRFISVPHADGTTNVFSYGEAFGTVSIEPLPAEGTATWRGAMVGQDVTTYDRYAGEANLVATFGEEQWIDVHFTGIANVETNAPREDISFEMTSLWPGTGFISWLPEDVAYREAPIYVRGWLLGPNHAEAAGVFGYNELVGAFGAKKQE